MQTACRSVRTPRSVSRLHSKRVLVSMGQRNQPCLPPTSQAALGSSCTANASHSRLSVDPGLCWPRLGHPSAAQRPRCGTAAPAGPARGAASGAGSCGRSGRGSPQQGGSPAGEPPAARGQHVGADRAVCTPVVGQTCCTPSCRGGSCGARCVRPDGQRSGRGSRGGGSGPGDAQQAFRRGRPACGATKRGPCCAGAADRAGGCQGVCLVLRAVHEAPYTAPRIIRGLCSHQR
jgi:hypothetical protein